MTSQQKSNGKIGFAEKFGMVPKPEPYFEGGGFLSFFSSYLNF